MYEFLQAHSTCVWTIGGLLTGLIGSYLYCVKPLKRSLKRVIKDYVIVKEDQLNTTIKYIFIIHHVSEALNWLSEQEICLPEPILLGLQDYQESTIEDIRALEEKGCTYIDVTTEE